MRQIRYGFLSPTASDLQAGRFRRTSSAIADHDRAPWEFPFRLVTGRSRTIGEEGESERRTWSPPWAVLLQLLSKVEPHIYPRGYNANTPWGIWKDKLAHRVAEKQKLLNRIRRLRGQIDALERAVDSEEGCNE